MRRTASRTATGAATAAYQEIVGAARVPAALTYWGMAWRNLWRQPLRAILTTLGVSVGVIAVVAMNSLIGGVEQSIHRGLRFAGADMVVFQAGVAADIFSSLDEESVRKALLDDPQVLEVCGGMSHLLPAKGSRFIVVLGLEKEGFAFPSEIVEGVPLSSSNEVALGTVASRTLQRRAGEDVELGGQTFRVANVFQTGVILFDGAIIMDLARLQDFLGRPGRVSAFFARLVEGANAQEVAARLERKHPELAVVTNVQEYRKVDTGLDFAKGMLRGITVASIIIGGLVVLNTMWMAVFERTREIGVLRAVGWSRRAVIGSILLESLGVGAAGAVVGSLLGVALANGIVRWSTAGQFVWPAHSIEPFLIVGAASILLSLLGGALPAWRAARISPAEALRHE